MKIHLLGAHNIESRDSKFTCLLIDDILALDSGGLTSSLTFTEQQQLKAIVLTHQHYDHLRDIPGLAMNYFLTRYSIDIYSTQPVGDALNAHMFNNSLYRNFLQKPIDDPTIRFNVIEPYQSKQIAGYSILPVPVKHSVPTIGLQVTSSDGKTLFYTGDTGPGLSECWELVSPQVLIIEVSTTNQWESFCMESGHLTAGLLKEELISFRNIKGYIPRVIAVHMNPHLQHIIEPELKEVAANLDATITAGYEGMKIEL